MTDSEDNDRNIYTKPPARRLYQWLSDEHEALNTLTHTFMQAVAEFGYSKTEAPTCRVSPVQFQ